MQDNMFSGSVAERPSGREANGGTTELIVEGEPEANGSDESR